METAAEALSQAPQKPATKTEPQETQRGKFLTIMLVLYAVNLLFSAYGLYFALSWGAFQNIWLFFVILVSIIIGAVIFVGLLQWRKIAAKILLIFLILNPLVSFFTTSRELTNDRVGSLQLVI